MSEVKVHLVIQIGFGYFRFRCLGTRVCLSVCEWNIHYIVPGRAKDKQIGNSNAHLVSEMVVVPLGGAFGNLGKHANRFSSSFLDFFIFVVFEKKSESNSLCWKCGVYLWTRRLHAMRQKPNGLYVSGATWTGHTAYACEVSVGQNSDIQSSPGHCRPRKYSLR